MNAIELFKTLCQTRKMENTVNINRLASLLNKPVVLVGLMGAGKTSLGQLLAQALNLEFIDSDNLIIAREGRSIADIFKNSGEPHFRALENKVIADLMNQAGLKVVGTGGGAFMKDETRQSIKENGISIFLDADLDVLLKRIGDGVGRPLFDGKNVKDVLSGLIDARYPIYNEADIAVKTKEEAVQETLNRVQQALYSHLSAG